MKIKVRLFGLLPRSFPGYDPRIGMEIDVPDGTRVQDLLARLEIPDPEADVIMANGMVLKFDSELEEEMCVDLFTLISGG